MSAWLAALAGRLADLRPARQVAALPWRREANGEVRVLLVTSRQTRRWILPKGWPMAGRTDPEAAAQEALEEAGAVGVVEPRPLGVFRYDKRLKRGRRRVRVTVYGLEVAELLDAWPEQDQRSRRWATPEDAAASVDEPELAALIRAFRPGRGL